MTAPALKSVMLPSFRNVSGLPVSLSVGMTAFPTGEPRPELKAVTTAPCMARPVRLNGSGPCARLSITHRPGCGIACPSFRTPWTGEVPIFLMFPIDFSTSVVMPPALLPGVGLTSSIFWP